MAFTAVPEEDEDLVAKAQATKILIEVFDSIEKHGGDKLQLRRAMVRQIGLLRGIKGGLAAIPSQVLQKMQAAQNFQQI